MAGSWLQIALDLFGAASPPPEPPGPRAGQAPDRLAEPTPGGSGGWYRHPRATRELRLTGARVGYELRRARRRTIGFTITAEGLVVAAPHWVGQVEIDRALVEKADWILRKLAHARDRQAQTDALRIDWKDGARVPYLGEPLRVLLDPDHRAGRRPLTEREATDPGRLRVGLAHDAQPTQIRDAVQAWLMREARALFTERLDHFAPRLGVSWSRLALSSAGTRWGSASADGSIRLHWRLVHFHMPVIDYVVAHELSHLRVMDHSPRFWETVESVVPDYAQWRRRLRQETLPPW